VIDSGLFHVYAGDEQQRRYVEGLKHVLEPGGRLFLFTFTEDAPEGGVSQEQLHEIFADGWVVESVELARGEVSSAFLAEFPDAFPESGLKGWFAIIRRND
jgi:cyclopropane fatty-acyl-phospholipid synthase-like methyltransferase